MEKWNLIIDVEKCENCNNCALATKDEHIGNDFPAYAAPMPLHGHDWIKIGRHVRGATPMVDVAYLPVTCNQCDNAPCIDAAGDGSVYKRADGIVIIDPVKARGRSDLVDSCPYGAIWWNEELKLPQKWIFDAHLLDNGWKEPRATQACPTGSMQALKVEDAEMRAIVENQKLEVLKPGLGTRPRVYYKNLHLWNKCFIGGSVTAKINGVVECVQDAKVIVLKNDKPVGEATTDVFGDFKIDRLEPKSGPYRVQISHAQHGSALVNAIVEESIYLGSIALDK
ncbi:MAG: oxidoreductase [Glaciimonas sp.]|nr:oxidoreductase [Glaciimonas sp.]